MRDRSEYFTLTRRVLTIMTVISAAGACVAGEEPDDADGDALAFDDPVAREPIADPAAPTMDDLRVRVGTHVPVFAGVYVEGDVLVALTTERVDAAHMWREIESVLDLPPEAPRRLVRPDARYSFVRLKRWHDAVTMKLLAVDAVQSTDIDERANAIVVGVVDDEGRAAARQILEDAGVPRDAADIITVEAVREHGLRDMYRPLVGGLQLAVPGGLCTLGFPAELAGVAGFVTCSHCTAQQGLKDTSKFGQPDGAKAVGTETKDPFYWAGGDCTVENGCRNSDSAFATASVDRAAKVALVKPGTLDIAKFARITGKEPWPMQGLPAMKVGRTTGGTQGTISSACVNVKSSTQYMYHCNHFVSGNSPMSQPGDSGSPVFRIANIPVVDDVRLLGLLWGGTTNAFVFSPIGALEKDLGSLKVCAPGFNC